MDYVISFIPYKCDIRILCTKYSLRMHAYTMKKIYNEENLYIKCDRNIVLGEYLSSKTLFVLIHHGFYYGLFVCPL